MVTSNTFLRLIALAPFAVSAFEALVLHEQAASVPAGWSLTSASDNDTQIVLQVALAQLESKLSSISTPGTSSHGQYLDIDATNALFGTSDTSKEAVKSWLKSSGISIYTAQGDSVWFKASVAQASSLIGTSFNTYTDT